MLQIITSTFCSYQRNIVKLYAPIFRSKAIGTLIWNLDAINEDFTWSRKHKRELTRAGSRGSAHGVTSYVTVKEYWCIIV